jgi:hypothetical protein
VGVATTILVDEYRRRAGSRRPQIGIGQWHAI